MYAFRRFSRRRGSSPLARGLLSGLICIIIRTGIIPARAGFTHGHLARDAAVRDHPRSRGVYTCLLRVSGSGGGSSPLARGLLPQDLREDLPRGIIPARAGFTTSLLSAPPCCRDHPRSRGVYSQTPIRTSCKPGSSPLARGLRMVRKGGRRRGGIIPARAGFTCAASTTMTSSTDHPRSRGVYGCLTLCGISRLGSSPLARGLPSR